MYKGVIFDIDNTLISTEDAIVEAFETLTMERLGKKFPHEVLKKIRGGSAKLALNTLGITEDHEDWIRAWNKGIKALHHKVYIFPHIKEVLDTLKSKDIPLCAVTNKTREEYFQDMPAFGLESYFPSFVCSDMVNKPKPAPDAVFQALRETNLHSQEVLYVGDTFYDSESAQGAGVDFGLAGWGTNNLNIDYKYLFRDPREILKFFHQ